MLSDRQKKIMIAIIESYTENDNSEPIGSNTLKTFEGLGVSSATLRNDMAELEELGYLEKTHTSSGRIPTEKGYRLYVDELMNTNDIEVSLGDNVASFIENSKLPVKDAILDLLKNVVDSAEFNYGALVLEKTAYNSCIKKIDFVELKNHHGMFLLVTDTGHLFSNNVLIPENVSMKNIKSTVDYLDLELHDVLLNDFKTAKVFKFNDPSFFEYMSNSEATIELVLRNILLLVEDKKHMIGQFNILKHHDFNDVNFAEDYLDLIKSNNIFNLIEFDQGPLPIIAAGDANIINIKVGSENLVPGMNKCSSISAYFKSKEGTGAILIYGPLRMKYRYIVALLNAVLDYLK